MIDIALHEIQPSVYVATSGNRYDLGNLFCCVQEYYESANERWLGRHFSRDDYQRWYALSVSEEAVFSYPADWCGFNVPSTAIEGYYHHNPYLTNNIYDKTMQAIDRTLRHRHPGPYYLIGIVEDDIETLDHELAHGFYSTNPVYKREMDEVITALPHDDRKAICTILTAMGYGENVHMDEIQANFATGLTDYFDGFEKYVPDFEAAFRKYKKPVALTPVHYTV